MTNIEKIQDLDSRIEQIEKEINDIDELYMKGFAPKGYGKGTSYNDYDTIPGGNKELHLEDYYQRKKKLEELLVIALRARLELKSEIDTDVWLELITDINDKVHFLRVIKGYTQAKTAEIIGISERTVQRIENNL